MIHADIRPSLIGVPVQRNENFIILDRLGDSSSPEVVQKKNMNKGKPIYMSPALFKGILNDKENIKHNPFKSDMFSLGLVLLEAGIFESVQKVYNIEKKDIDKEELILLVEKFIHRYPEDYILQECLMIMLEFSPRLRQDPLTLLKTLRVMERIAKKKGEAMVSQVNYQKDAIATQLKFTESGYELKDMNRVQYSYYHRVDGNLSLDPALNDQTGDEMENSLVNRVKKRASVVDLTEIKQPSKMFEEVKEDLEGEISERGSSLKIHERIQIVEADVIEDQETREEKEESFEIEKERISRHIKREMEENSRFALNEELSRAKSVSDYFYIWDYSTIR